MWEEAWFSISIREITFREQELNWLFAKYKRLENNPLYGNWFMVWVDMLWFASGIHFLPGYFSACILTGLCVDDGWLHHKRSMKITHIIIHVHIIKYIRVPLNRLQTVWASLAFSIVTNAFINCRYVALKPYRLCQVSSIVLHFNRGLRDESVLIPLISCCFNPRTSA